MYGSDKISQNWFWSVIDFDRSFFSLYYSRYINLKTRSVYKNAAIFVENMYSNLSLVGLATKIRTFFDSKIVKSRQKESIECMLA